MVSAKMTHSLFILLGRSLAVLLAMVFICMTMPAGFSFAEDSWDTAPDLTFKGGLDFSKPLTGVYNQGTFRYDDAQDVTITAAGSLYNNATGETVTNFTDIPAVLQHGERYDYFQFDIDRYRVKIHSEMEGFRAKTVAEVLERKEG